MGTIEQWNNENRTNKQKAVSRAATGLRPAAKNKKSPPEYKLWILVIMTQNWDRQEQKFKFLIARLRDIL